jgi:hypothetical protein
LLVLLLALAQTGGLPLKGPVGAAGAAAPAAIYTMQGRVYQGAVGDQSQPLRGVTVQAYGANSAYPTSGVLITSTTTDSTGWYGLAVTDGFEFYSIRQVNLPGYVSVGATTVSGTVRTADWIELGPPLSRQTLTGNKFWDLGAPPPSEPVTGSTRAIVAAQDAYVLSTAPGVNFGAQPELRSEWRTGGVAAESVALVRFDVSDLPTNTAIVSAWLGMVLSGTQDTAKEVVGVHEVVAPWDEMAVTWSLSPTFAAGPLTTADVPTVTERHAWWDITPLMVQWVANPSGNLGLALVMENRVDPGSYRVFGSREGGIPPMVTFVYTLPVSATPPPVPMPLPVHVTTTLSAAATAPLLWTGSASMNAVAPDPGPITLSFDSNLGRAEARLLQFDFAGIPSTTAIYDARLELWLEGGTNPQPGKIEDLMMDVPWSPVTATMRNSYWFANNEADAPMGFAVVDLDPSRWISLDLTRQVQRWVSGRASNNGVQIRPPDGLEQPWSRAFAGVSAGDHAPRLVIRHAPLGETATATQPSTSYESYCYKLTDTFDTLFRPCGLRKQWSTISSYKVITGTAHSPRVSYTEWPATHDGHDFNFDVAKNATNAWALSDVNPNDIEVEWEINAFPMWAWPDEGDEVMVFGPWIADCGHDAKTEIHPPFGIVSVRDNEAVNLTLRGGYGTVLGRRADVFFSSQRTQALCGGWCEDSACLDEYPLANVGAQDYEFDLYPPANRDTVGELVVWTIDQTGSFGTAVKPTVAVSGTGASAWVHVKLPYSGKSGQLHTATQVYYAWTRTTDPALRGFKVQIHGIDIYDNTDLFDADWYAWASVNGKYFNLRDYISGLSDAGDEYYSVDTKSLVAHVVVPNNNKGRIQVRVNGYERDCLDTLYGYNSTPAAELFPIAACYLGTGDNDRLRAFTKVFTKTQSFGGGTRGTYGATGDGDGDYGLDVSVAEEAAPLAPSALNMEAAVADPTMTTGGVTLDGVCLYDEYANSQVVTFTLSSGVNDVVSARAAYDDSNLYVCVNDIPQAAFDSGAQQAVIYLDGGPQTAPKVSAGWTNRGDDLRIAFSTSPQDTLVARQYQTASGWYASVLGTDVVTAAKSSGFGYLSIEFRLHKSLVADGPWSQTYSEKNLFNVGIGTMLAIEASAGSKRLGAWPSATTAYSTDPRTWGRMTFSLDCPISLTAKRVGPVLKGPLQKGKLTLNLKGKYGGVFTSEIVVAGGDTQMTLNYKRISSLPRCNLKQGKLVASWPSENLSLVKSSPQGVEDSGVITWTLPSTTTSGTASFWLRYFKQCEMQANTPHPYLTADGTLTTSFASQYVQPLSVQSSDDVLACSSVKLPDTRTWPGGWPKGVVPPWIVLHDPVRLGDPVDLRVQVSNDELYARSFTMKALVVPVGVSSARPSSNHMLDFANAPVLGTYNVPANSTISVRANVLPGMAGQSAQRIQIVGPTTLAVEVSQPDGGGPPWVTMQQSVDYVALTPGATAVYTATVWHTVREPAELHLEAISNCPGWWAAVEPGVLPAQTPGTPAPARVYIRPPADAILGSGCPIDLVAWTEEGEFAGSLRLLDLPPVQMSTGDLPFVSSQIVLEPSNPGPGAQARACVLLHNRADVPREAEVLLGMSNRLETSPMIGAFVPMTATLPPGGAARVCGPATDWTGPRSLQAIVRQNGYADQVMQRNAAQVTMPPGGAPAVVPLYVRNPLTSTAVLSLTADMAGLPGWQVSMPPSVNLGAGEAATVTVLLSRGVGVAAVDALPGSEGYVEVWVTTQANFVVGGARLNVWQRSAPLYLPLVMRGS